MSDNQGSLQPSLHNEGFARGSSWKQVYRNVRHEKDVNRLTEAVMAAETAIYERMQELSGLSDHADERAEIEAANKELLKVKTQKLGWPNPVA